MIEAHYNGVKRDKYGQLREYRGTEVGSSAFEALQKIESKVQEEDWNWYENTRLYVWNGSYMEVVEKPEPSSYFNWKKG